MVAAATPSVFDNTNLAAIKYGVKTQDPKALKAAAQQFEALFMQMMLKAMREATPKDGLFDNDQTRLYESLLDQQMSLVMSSKKSMGLAGIIEQQLGRVNSPAQEFPAGLPVNPPAKAYPADMQRNAAPAAAPVQAAPAKDASASNAVAPVSAEGSRANAATPNAFIQQMWPHAVATAQATGIPPHFLLAQAALETGWGRSLPRHANGQSSHNLFGIKAGASWSGAVTEVSTTEYVDGEMQQQSARFRAYNSPAESFRDYANLLLNNPRYANVLEARDAKGFAQALQTAGYATDPAYAAKLTRVIGVLS